VNNSKRRVKNSTITRSFWVLDKSDRKKLFFVTCVQVATSLSDLLGVIAIGLLGAIALASNQVGAQDARLESTLSFLNLSDLEFQMQVGILGSAGVFLLVGRTLFSVFFTRRILFFLSRRGAKISADTISRLLSQSLLVIQSRTTQEMLYAVTKGVELIVLQVLAVTIVLISDFSLLLIMTIGLLVVDPKTAFGLIILFSAMAIFLYRFMTIRAGKLGIRSSELNIVSNEKIVEVFASYRESVVRNRRHFYSREISTMRFSLADTMAEMNFLPYVSKYVIELSVIIGALALGIFEFFTQDMNEAVTTLVIFLLAGTRIAPAVLRVQQGMITIKGALGQAESTLKLIESLETSKDLVLASDDLNTTHKDFNPEIQIRDVSLTYPNTGNKAISGISLDIQSGSSVAIVGPTGSGKTTLIDLILGVLIPDVGSVLISGLSPLEAINKWSGAISYVPQDVVIISGTFRQNVALGYKSEEATDERVLEALRLAQLDSFVSGLPEGVDTQVGERGSGLSGGQRQRLGIARAMFTKPKLLVLDEATSSLDGQTEENVVASIQALKGKVTVIVIAHRLSTVRNSDLVVYIESGKIESKGTFDGVRNQVPNFNYQAQIMGL